MSAPSQVEILELLATLIAFPTVSSESNLDLIQWVEHYLDGLNVLHWRINEAPKKSSLLARIGPEAEGGIVFSGHSDVVPVKDQPWSSDPFTLTERAGKFYGRGTSDMKAFIALALAFVPHFQSAKLTKPIWLAISHDEEIGCLGAPAMAAAIAEHAMKPALVVIGEPTEMKLVTAHKGILSYETVITGREAHSSMPDQGVNAVMLMAELMGTLNKIAGSTRAKPKEGSRFVTPYSSVHIGVVEGGTARNIIPRHCRIAWEVRPLPGEDVDALLAPFRSHADAMDTAIKRQDAKCGVVTRKLTEVRGLHVADDAGFLPLAMRLAGSNDAHAVAFGTEGGIFEGAGLPTIVCGPGSIDQAHQPDEFLAATQLTLGADFMLRVAEACAGK